jgi:hypothetical protein
MATGGGRISLPWPLGWIAATPNGRICFFFLGSPEMVVDGDVCLPEVGGGWHILGS